MPESKKAMKWYLRPASIVIAILVVGPFALPLVWMSPAFNKWAKVLITAGLIILTIWAIKASADLIQLIFKQMQELQASF